MSPHFVQPRTLMADPLMTCPLSECGSLTVNIVGAEAS